MVGTIEVRDTRTTSNPSFSNASVVQPPLTSGALTNELFFGSSPFPRKQVVILQCVNADGSIAWQRYFYGWSPTLLGGAPAQYERAVCARGISVWAAPLDANAHDTDTRIAICGETSDDEIPLSQGGWTQQASPIFPPSFTGFIAVYDGDGDLKWSFNFFGDPPQASSNEPDCAITDVSIRTETRAGVAKDVVTYCGISSWGLPGAGCNCPLTPLRPFASGHGCPTAAGGDTNNGPQQQWDGIVGRLSNDHVAPVPAATTQEFHSIVGGGEQDGLFGIAEMEDQRFVVVGGTSRLVSPGTSATFPFDFGCADARHRVGVVMTFDASKTLLPSSPANVLELQSSIPLGRMAMVPGSNPDRPYSTIARDVLVHLDHLLGASTDGPVGFPEFHVVGATDDPGMFSVFQGSTTGTWFLGQHLATMQGPSDGFAVSLVDLTQPYALYPVGAGYVGGPGADGLTGVSSWNEHQDHFQVCGYTIPPQGGSTDILVASMFLNMAYEMISGPPVSAWYANPLIEIRTDTIGGSGEDRPTALGSANATAFVNLSGVQPGSDGKAFTTGLEVLSAPPFDNVGNPGGGGIAVDQSGRVTVVGRTRSANYPVSQLPFVPGRSGLGAAGLAEDAVRTDIDMLPPGVSRTDATGSRAATPPPPMVPVPPPPPAAGYSGGTTPTCALGQFGRRPNEPRPLLPRTLVEFEGQNQSSQTPSFLFTRPPVTSVVLGTFLQVGFPGSALFAQPTPLMYFDTELWLLDPSGTVSFLSLSPSMMFFNAPGSSWWIDGYQSWRFTMPAPLDPAYTPISVQLLTLITCDLSTWGACGGCDGAFTLVATPALTVEF